MTNEELYAKMLKPNDDPSWGPTQTRRTYVEMLWPIVRNELENREIRHARETEDLMTEILHLRAKVEAQVNVHDVEAVGERLRANAKAAFMALDPDRQFEVAEDLDLAAEDLTRHPGDLADQIVAEVVSRGMYSVFMLACGRPNMGATR